MRYTWLALCVCMSPASPVCYTPFVEKLVISGSKLLHSCWVLNMMWGSFTVRCNEGLYVTVGIDKPLARLIVVLRLDVDNCAA